MSKRSMDMILKDHDLLNDPGSQRSVAAQNDFGLIWVKVMNS
jgi:hypothetical protein